MFRKIKFPKKNIYLIKEINKESLRLILRGKFKLKLVKLSITSANKI